MRAAVRDAERAEDDSPSGPALAKLYNARAYCRAKMDDFRGAVADYTHALDRDPDNAHALHNRGISHDRLGNDAAAMRDFNRVLDLERSKGATSRESPTSLEKSSESSRQS